MKTVKIKSTDKSQGDYVVINECDFDKEKHVLFINKPTRKAKESSTNK